MPRAVSGLQTRGVSGHWEQSEDDSLCSPGARPRWSLEWTSFFGAEECLSQLQAARRK